MSALGLDRWVAAGLAAAALAQGALLLFLSPLSGRSAWQAGLLALAVTALVHQGWIHRLQLHHRVDMTLVMLSLGGLGMLVGTWADAGFGDLTRSAPSCCHPSAAGASGSLLGTFFSWMTGLMLLFSVPASLVLTRCAALARQSARHGIATHVAGNLGMIVGMIGVGRAFGETLGGALGSALIGMHLAMLAGMLVGMPAAEWLAQAALGLKPWRAASGVPVSRGSLSP